MSATDTIPKKPRSGWAYIWLAYVGFLFIDPILEPSLRLWIATIAVFAVFLGIFVAYVRSTDEGSQVRFWMIAAIFVLGLITFPWNPGASTFFVYAAAFLPFAFRSTRVVLSLFFIESLIILAEGYLFHTRGRLFYIEWPNVLIAIFLVLIIGSRQHLLRAAEARRPQTPPRTGRKPRPRRRGRTRTHRPRPSRRPRPHLIGHRAQSRAGRTPHRTRSATRRPGDRRRRNEPPERPSAKYARPSVAIVPRACPPKWNSPATPCRQQA